MCFLAPSSCFQLQQIWSRQLKLSHKEAKSTAFVFSGMGIEIKTSDTKLHPEKITVSVPTPPDFRTWALASEAWTMVCGSAPGCHSPHSRLWWEAPAPTTVHFLLMPDLFNFEIFFFLHWLHSIHFFKFFTFKKFFHL